MGFFTASCTGTILMSGDACTVEWHRVHMSEQRVYLVADPKQEWVLGQKKTIVRPKRKISGKVA